MVNITLLRVHIIDMPKRVRVPEVEIFSMVYLKNIIAYTIVLYPSKLCKIMKKFVVKITNI